MNHAASYPRVNIYLNDPELRHRIKVAASLRGQSISAYCLDAIRDHLAADEAEIIEGASSESNGDAARQTARKMAAKSLKRLRREIGPVGVPVSELIAEGRR